MLHELLREFGHVVWLVHGLKNYFSELPELSLFISYRTQRALQIILLTLYDAKTIIKVKIFKKLEKNQFTLKNF